jgi:hypothetical protein
MNTPPKNEKPKDHNFRSSISVSNKKVCEDEACIGKDVNPAADTPSEASQPEKSEKKTVGDKHVGWWQGSLRRGCMHRKKINPG